MDTDNQPPSQLDSSLNFLLPGITFHFCNITNEWNPLMKGQNEEECLWQQIWVKKLKRKNKENKPTASCRG